MHVKYIGPHSGAEIDWNDFYYVCDKDEVIEVPDQLGKALVLQPSNWEPVKKSPAKTAPVKPDSEDKENN